MPDVYLCAYCGSTDLMHQMDAVQCLQCGNRTRYDGTKCPEEPVFVEGPTAWERRPK